MTEPPKASCKTEYHCFSSARVGTTTSVLRPTRSIALTATAVFPAPVGRTSTPRSPLLRAQGMPHEDRASAFERDPLEGRGPVLVRHALGAQVEDRLTVGACGGPPLAGPSVPD